MRVGAGCGLAGEDRDISGIMSSVEADMALWTRELSRWFILAGPDDLHIPCGSGRTAQISTQQVQITQLLIRSPTHTLINSPLRCLYPKYNNTSVYYDTTKLTSSQVLHPHINHHPHPQSQITSPPSQNTQAHQASPVARRSDPRPMGAEEGDTSAWGGGNSVPGPSQVSSAVAGEDDEAEERQRVAEKSPHARRYAS
jgi:hypothetical protein